MMAVPLQNTRIAGQMQEQGASISDPMGLFLDQLGIRCRVIGEWTATDRLELPLRECQAGFCLVTSGIAVAEVAGKSVGELSRGDLALFLREDRRSAIHVCASPSRPSADSPLQRLFQNGTPPSARLVSGLIEFRADARVLTAGSLPEVIRLQHEQGRDRLIDSLVDWTLKETNSHRGGRLAVVNQLLSTICLESLRQHVATFDLDLCGLSPAWLTALRDAEVGMILSQMLLHPDQDWTVESLAEVVPMARSTFARKFRQLTGGSPMSVLLEIRMHNACDLLRSSRPLKDVARHAGYRSLSAFTTAFRRWSGQTPQSYRFASRVPESSGQISLVDES
ncbi:MAG: helix-turn-helix transcriptional regulator [Planctomycetaceae bacterium]